MFGTIYKRLKQFLQEYKKWKEYGKPLRSANEMLEIYSICESNECGFFRTNEVTGHKECGSCGCRLHPSDTDKPNKIAWATSYCPEGHWKADLSSVKLKQSSSTRSINDCGCGK